jgi:NAD-dependent dihydropyrimidine dehydrogenase PreA subunit
MKWLQSGYSKKSSETVSIGLYTSEQAADALQADAPAQDAYTAQDAYACAKGQADAQYDLANVVSNAMMNSQAYYYNNAVINWPPPFQTTGGSSLTGYTTTSGTITSTGSSAVINQWYPANINANWSMGYQLSPSADRYHGKPTFHEADHVLPFGTKCGYCGSPYDSIEHTVVYKKKYGNGTETEDLEECTACDACVFAES